MVNSTEIAAAFQEISDLMELQGEDKYKIQAYRRAVASLHNLSITIQAALEDGQLSQIPGIGRALEAKIIEYVQTGKIATLERLRQRVPRSLLEITKVPGIGPKTAMRLYQELGVTDLESLRKMVNAGSLRTITGLGLKKEAAIIAGLTQLSQSEERIPLMTARSYAQALEAALVTISGVTHVAAAGSLRRQCATVSDIDMVVACSQPRNVARFLTQLSVVERFLAQGDTLISFLLHSGVHVDVRIVTPDLFSSALHHFTGSSAHHKSLRHLALSKGFSISEYGLLNTSSGERIVPSSEEELYERIGLPFIPPELREGAGEIEAGLAGKLPDLVHRSAVKGDLHVHSNWSDGDLSLSEIAQEAERRGLDYVAVCDHSPRLTIAGGLSVERLRARNREIMRINEQGNGAVLLCGVEVDILADGSLDYPDEILAQQDIVVASIHSGFHQERNRIMSRLKQAMQNPLVHILGHPTGRLLLKRQGYDIDYDELIHLAQITECTLEINASPHRLDLPDTQARVAGSQGVMLAINTDAHNSDEFDFLSYGVGVARRAWLEPHHILNCLSLTSLQAKLAQKRSNR